VGYVHEAPIFHSNRYPKAIEFIITPRYGAKKFSMFLIALDNNCYKIN
jgi:hypothetical protein